MEFPNRSDMERNAALRGLNERIDREREERLEAEKKSKFFKISTLVISVLTLIATILFGILGVLK